MALKSPRSDVRSVSSGVNIAKEGCEKTFQMLQPAGESGRIKVS